MNKAKARNIMIGTALLVTAINISVFNIWIPARLQVSARCVLPVTSPQQLS